MIQALYTNSRGGPAVVANYYQTRDQEAGNSCILKSINKLYSLSHKLRSPEFGCCKTKTKRRCGAKKFIY